MALSDKYPVTLYGQPTKYTIGDILKEKNSDAVIIITGFEKGLVNKTIEYSIEVILPGERGVSVTTKREYVISIDRLENEQHFKLYKDETLEILYGRNSKSR